MHQSAYIRMALVITILSLGVLSGCATILKGSTQKIPVASDPSNADVTADGQLFGQTPMDLTLKRKRDHLVTISKKGYSPKSVAIVKSTGGAVWGNILAGGIIGWGVDASTGAQYNLSPESINVRLELLDEEKSATTSGQSKSGFVRKLNDLDELKDAGSISDEEYSKMRTSLFRQYYPDMDTEVRASSDTDPPNVGNQPPLSVNKEAN